MHITGKRDFVNSQHLKDIRIYELARVMPLMPKGSYVLEIGSGAGWQAKHLAENGFVVEAIDLKQSNYAGQRVWPVQNYDGTYIPFQDNSFDIIFSSNVLEHIPHIEDFQIEIQRVLKSGGVAIHVLPTATWRFWTNISFYMVRAKQILSIATGGKRNSTETFVSETKDQAPSANLTFIQTLFKAMLPPAHGAIGNSVTQLYGFSRFRWIRLFTKTGWSVTDCLPNRLFYTGHLLCGSLFTIRFRHWSSYLMGSSCLIYVLTKNRETEGV